MAQTCPWEFGARDEEARALEEEEEEEEEESVA